MAELDKNPQMIRQGAAAAACVVAAAAAMPAISHRAAEQRADAQWAARSAAFQRVLQAELQAQGGALEAVAAPATARMPIALAAYTPPSGELGYRARGAVNTATAQVNHEDAIRIGAALRDQAAFATVAAFQPAKLQASRVTAKEQHCLAQAIYYEARGESHIGQAAVAEVVMNRVHSSVYPNTICEVVYQGSWRSTGCQFTFTCDGSLKKKPRGPAWRDAKMQARQTMLGLSRALTNRATHYHTTAIDPYWSASLIETTRIGAHIFYRFPNRRERATLYSAAQAADIDPVAIAPAPEPDLVISPDGPAPEVVALGPLARSGAPG